MKKMFLQILSLHFVTRFRQSVLQPNSKSLMVLFLILSCAGVYIGCKKDGANAIDKKIQSQLDTLSSQTSAELQQAWEASSRYQNIENAFTDKYADINVVMPNMGTII